MPLTKLTAREVKLARQGTGGNRSQAAWSRKIGVTVVQVSRWENGHATPSPVFTRKIRQLARLEGVVL